MAIYKFLVALPVVLTALFIHACSSHFSGGKLVYSSDIVNLEDLAKGGKEVGYTVVLPAGTLSYRLTENTKNPVDLTKVKWQIERLNSATNEVIAQVPQANLYDKIECKEGETLKISIASTTQEPLKGGLFGMVELSRKGLIALGKTAEDVPQSMPPSADFKLVQKIPIDGTFTEKNVVINTESGVYFVEIVGTGSKEADGIKIYGFRGNDKKFSNYYNQKFFSNVSYRSRNTEELKISIQRDPALAAEKGAIAIFFKQVPESSKQ
jgi:hypothetical protein